MNHHSECKKVNFFCCCCSILFIETSKRNSREAKKKREEKNCHTLMIWMCHDGNYSFYLKIILFFFFLWNSKRITKKRNKFFFIDINFSPSFSFLVSRLSSINNFFFFFYHKRQKKIKKSFNCALFVLLRDYCCFYIWKKNFTLYRSIATHKWRSAKERIILWKKTKRVREKFDKFKKEKKKKNDKFHDQRQSYLNLLLTTLLFGEASFLKCVIADAFLWP